MQYLGGKTRIAKALAAEINKVRRPGQLVWDAFCGGLSMSCALSVAGPVLSTDACAPLIALYQAVQAGWEPPTVLSREEYHVARSLPDSDPLKAFAGFGCSFGGKWFGGYASGFNGPLTYVQLAARNVKRSVTAGCKLARISFLDVEPGPCDAVLYLDPPYRGTTGYAGVPPFDYDAFGQAVVDWSEFADVFVSEYAFPIGAVVWERASRGTLGLTHGVAHVEHLYYIARRSL